jgi:hypothetical protein
VRCPARATTRPGAAVAARCSRAAGRCAAVCIWLAASASGGGCASRASVSEIAAIYDHVHGDDRALARHDPIVVVPGFLGSTLAVESTGEVLWGRFLGRSQRPRDPAFIRALALPVADAPLAQLRDDVVVTGAMRVAELDIGRTHVEVNAYPGVLSGILVGWDAGDAPTMGRLTRAARDSADTQLPLLDEVGYDWRRDVAESAATLHTHLVEAHAHAVAKRRALGLPSDDVRLDVIAHSTGCLVLRYYLRYGTQPLPDDGSLPPVTWEGHALVRRAVLVAPPNRGSLSAFETLRAGGKPIPVLPRFSAPLLGSFVSLYQLMPPPAQAMVVYGDGAPIDLYDVGVWERYGWGLFAPDEDDVLRAMLPEAGDRGARVAIARRYTARALARARQFHEALSSPASPPPGTTLHLFAADGIATPRQLVIDRASGNVLRRETGPGDGVVPRDSALADVRPFDSDLRPLVGPVDWESVHWVRGDHLGLIGEPGFVDNLLFMLFEDPRWTLPVDDAPAVDDPSQAAELLAPAR